MNKMILCSILYISLYCILCCILQKPQAETVVSLENIAVLYKFYKKKREKNNLL